MPVPMATISILISGQVFTCIGIILCPLLDKQLRALDAFYLFIYSYQCVVWLSTFGIFWMYGVPAHARRLQFLFTSILMTQILLWILSFIFMSTALQSFEAAAVLLLMEWSQALMWVMLACASIRCGLGHRARQPPGEGIEEGTPLSEIITSSQIRDIQIRVLQQCPPIPTLVLPDTNVDECPICIEYLRGPVFTCLQCSKQIHFRCFMAFLFTNCEQSLRMKSNYVQLRCCMCRYVCIAVDLAANISATANPNILEQHHPIAGVALDEEDPTPRSQSRSLQSSLSTSISI